MNKPTLRRRIRAALLAAVMTVGDWLCEVGYVLMRWAFDRLRKRATEGESDERSRP